MSVLRSVRLVAHILRLVALLGCVRTFGEQTGEIQRQTGFEQVKQYCKTWAAHSDTVSPFYDDGYAYCPTLLWVLSDTGSRDITSEEVQISLRFRTPAEPPMSGYYQQRDYCKKWAADPRRVPVWYLEGPRASSSCANMIAKDPGLLEFSSDEYATATEWIRLQEKSFKVWGNFHSSRCSSDDPRSLEDRSSDPVCIKREEGKRQYQAQLKAEIAKEAAAKAKIAQAVARLGLHRGQSQAEVKAILQKQGFSMPWACAGSWEGATWIAGCRTHRGQANILVLFDVYRRVRTVNPDTGMSTLSEVKTDRLIRLEYEGQ